MEGNQNLRGFLRGSSSRTYWTPENDTTGNYWFWVDPPTMAKIAGEECLPLVVDLSAGLVLF